MTPSPQALRARTEKALEPFAEMWRRFEKACGDDRYLVFSGVSTHASSNASSVCLGILTASAFYKASIALSTPAMGGKDGGA